MKILGVDPGERFSGVVLWDSETEVIVEKAEMGNEDLAVYLKGCALPFPSREVDVVAVENVASYGMPVGAEVFETCRWIGEFRRITKDLHLRYVPVPRKEIMLHLCCSARAKDKNIHAALTERFGDYSHGKTGKGTKKFPGKLFGVKDHLWSALAVAVVMGDMEKEKR